MVDALPWNTGRTEAQAKQARGRASALAHQIAALLAGGWTMAEVRDALSAATTAPGAPDAAAQERGQETSTVPRKAMAPRRGQGRLDPSDRR